MEDLLDILYEPFVPSIPSKFVVLGTIKDDKGVEKLIVFSTFRWMDEEYAEKYLKTFLGVNQTFHMVACIPTDGHPFYLKKTAATVRNCVRLKELFYEQG